MALRGILILVLFAHVGARPGVGPASDSAGDGMRWRGDVLNVTRAISGGSGRGALARRRALLERAGKSRKNGDENTCEHNLGFAAGSFPLFAQEIFEKDPGVDLVVPDKKRWGSCALVGNSGMLARSTFGELIDQHQLVARINQAPTLGYASKVGKKTQIRFLNNLWGQRYSMRPGEGTHKDHRVVGYLPRERGMLLAATRLQRDSNGYNRLRRINDATGLRGVVRLSEWTMVNTKQTLDDFRACEEGRTRRHFEGGDSPSTGLLALTVLQAFCDSVTVFGFGGGRRPVGFPYHYYHWRSSQLTAGYAGHAFDLEERVIEVLAQEKVLTRCAFSGGCMGKNAGLDRLPVADRARMLGKGTGSRQQTKSS